MPLPEQEPLSIPRPEVCSDEDERCPEWAAAGQCDSNADFMIGNGFGCAGEGGGHACMHAVLADRL